MKKICILLSLALFSGAMGKLSAQTFAEFFKQKQTQKKYLLQQIAALQVYTQLAKKGYAVVSGGLQLIGDIKNGKLRLDKDYFEGLNTTNRILQQTDKPISCQHLWFAIKQIYTKAKYALSSPVINSEENSYIHLV